MARIDMPICGCPACGKRYRPGSQKRYRAPGLPVSTQTVRPPKVWQAVGSARYAVITTHLAPEN
jgi:hypothetical protein